MTAIIPARGGSKRLPGKNIKDLCGKPLIAYTIDAAKGSKLIERIIVSTDSKEIADIALFYGAEVPFLRPSELSSDKARSIDVIFYTVDRLNQDYGYGIDELILLQPTSPLRTSQDINNAIDVYTANNAEAVISVTESEHPPDWYKTINEKGILKNYFDGSATPNRQEYSKAYLPNGAIYIFNYHFLKKQSDYYSEKTYPYVMSAESSVDIDTALDFMLAETILGSMQK
ncbi:MAG: acylneuraminate cytidylyltransferase family protein [Oscillospiraceae bacterium]|nr:acylneuraminate cytidylyltransferase family protein [Oscillospiraceae bacterium]